MATISERLRDSDLLSTRMEAADTIDALVAALEAHNALSGYASPEQAALYQRFVDLKQAALARAKG